MTHRPLMISTPIDPWRVQRLRQRLKACEAQLPDDSITSLGQLTLACEIFLLGLILERGSIYTGEAFRLLITENPELSDILAAEPLYYTNACITVDNFCRGCHGD